MEVTTATATAKATEGKYFIKMRDMHKSIQLVGFILSSLYLLLYLYTFCYRLLIFFVELTEVQFGKV